MAFLDKTGCEHLWAQIVNKLSGKVDKVSGKGLSTNDYTTTEKNKLAGIAEGANKTVVDSALSATSTNPVQNKAVNTAIQNLSTLVGDESVATQISRAVAGKADIANGQYAVTASSSDGVAYTATVPGITSLTAGASFIMIPGRVSASTTPTLNVNSLGAKNIRRRLSSLATGVQAGYTTTWLAVNMPFRVVYDGTQWVVEGQNKPASADLYGTLAVNKGGTGATDAATALSNLGAQPALGYTPVSQGTGTGQGTNKVHIGWATDSTGLKVTVDETDLGYIYTSAIGKRALSTEGGTMIGEIVATNNNGGFRCDNGTYSIGLRIGASGVSRGIYDDTNGRWILYSDGTATTKVGGSQDPAQSCLRNIGCGTAALVAGSSTLTTGAIYIQYE